MKEHILLLKRTLLLALVVIAVVAAVYFVFSKSNFTGLGSPKSFEIQGMKVEVLKQGTGEMAKEGDQLTTNYVLTLQDGKEIDSSVKRNQPVTFTLGPNGMIKGLELGITGMKVGESRKLTIPPELAFGAQGIPPVIPPDSTVIYVIDRVQ